MGSACEKGGVWGEALALLGSMARDRIDRNTITYSAAISACEKGGVWGEALVLLGSMARDRIDGDTTTYNAAISACEKGGVGRGVGTLGQHGEGQDRSRHHHL